MCSWQKPLVFTRVLSGFHTGFSVGGGGGGGGGGGMTYW